MEEIDTMHQINLEWGCITNLMDKICNLEDKIDGGWPELIDMVSEAVSEEGENKDPMSAFFNLYQFLWRLYYRLKANPTKRPFNQYHKGKDRTYWVGNYTYAMLKWANTNGFAREVDNNTIKIPADKLNDTQRRALDRRCK